jgi:hypothetical protein
MTRSTSNQVVRRKEEKNGKKKPKTNIKGIRNGYPHACFMTVGIYTGKEWLLILRAASRAVYSLKIFSSIFFDTRKIFR